VSRAGAALSRQLLPRRLCGFVVSLLFLAASYFVSTPRRTTHHLPFTAARHVSVLRWFPNHSSARVRRWAILWASLANRASSALAAAAPPTENTPQPEGAHHSKKRSLSSGSPSRQRQQQRQQRTSSDSQDSLDDEDDVVGPDGSSSSSRGLIEDDNGNVWLRYVDGQGDYQLYRVPPWVSDLPLDRSHRIREAMNALLEDTLDDIERLLAHLEDLGGKDGVDLESDDFVIDDEDDDAVAMSVLHEFFGDVDPDGEEVEGDDDDDEDDEDETEEEDNMITEDDDDDDHIGDFGSESASADDDEGDEDAERNVTALRHRKGDGHSKKKVREPLARVVQFADYTDYDEDEYDAFFRDPADWIDSDPTYKREFDALAAIFDEVKGSSSPDDLQSRFHWLQRDHDYCAWGGVVCDLRAVPRVSMATSRSHTNVTDNATVAMQPVVTKIELPRAGLTGTVPMSVVQLDYLEVLNLANNRLKGTIPWAAYENLTRTALRILDLSHNQLTGTIPLFQLLHLNHPNATEHNTSSVLEELRLSFNDFTGALIPPAAKSASSNDLPRSFKSSVTGTEPIGGSASFVSPLRWLDLAGNRLSGALPRELSQLLRLEFLALGDNWFSGRIPDLRNASSLRYVDLGSNLLNSSASSLIESLPTRVRQVNAGQNLLHGTLPTDLWRIRRLELLILSDNQIGGTLPTSKSTITGRVKDAGGKRKDVDVTMDGSAITIQNKSLSSHSYDSLKKLRLWWVARNSIRGDLPADLFVGLQSPLESYVALALRR
jgi:hypothetical protein